VQRGAGGAAIGAKDRVLFSYAAFAQRHTLPLVIPLGQPKRSAPVAAQTTSPQSTPPQSTPPLRAD